MKLFIWIRFININGEERPNGGLAVIVKTIARAQEMLKGSEEGKEIGDKYPDKIHDVEDETPESIFTFLGNSVEY